MPRAIRQLTAVTRARLRSTQILTSLWQIVSELVQNSLDAEASEISIGIDCTQWTCWVCDDGAGISIEDLRHMANVDDSARYRTSKLHLSDEFASALMFGFRGEVLASAAEVSCLEISSRTVAERESWSVIIKGGKPLYFGKALRWRRERPGTVVCVRDAFFNLPVRRLAHISPSRTIDAVINELQSIALVFPHVSFSVESINSTGYYPGESQKKRVMSIAKAGSTMHAFRAIFGRSLAENVEDIDVKDGDLRITGFISLSSSLSKGHQFLYINRHLLTPSGLHKVIEDRFNCSPFGRTPDGDNALDSSVRRSPRKRMRHPIYALNIEVPSRTLDICLISIKEPVHFENHNVVSSLLEVVVDSFLRKHGFRVATYSSQRSQPASHPSGSQSPARPCWRKLPVVDASPLRQQIHLTSDTAVLDLFAVDSHAFRRNTSQRVPSMMEVRRVQLGDNQNTNLLVRQRRLPEDMEMIDSIVDWIDPRPGKNSVTDPGASNLGHADSAVHAGCAANLSTRHPRHHSKQRDQTASAASRSGPPYVDRSSLRRWRTRNESRNTAQQKMDVECTGITNNPHSSRQVDPQWITNLLTEWENPVFKAGERDVPIVTSSLVHGLSAGFPFPARLVGRPLHRPGIDIAEPIRGLDPHDPPVSTPWSPRSKFFSRDSNIPTFGHAGHGSLLLHSAFSRFSKDDLRNARVINQVDNKFVLCTVPRVGDQSKPGFEGNSEIAARSNILILVDQHAADERIRVEKYLREICMGFLYGDIERRDLIFADDNGAHKLRRIELEGIFIVLTLQEAKLLQESFEFSGHKRSPSATAILDRWGFRINTDSLKTVLDLAEEGSDVVQVQITTVPEIVADKLLALHAADLQDLVRSLIDRFHDVSLGELPEPVRQQDASSEDMNDPAYWMRALRWCPKELVDLINSKACRGAIMFNDPLTKEQCERLTTQLSFTAFPFQCAHGRPSMVPLTSFGDMSRRPRVKTLVDWETFRVGVRDEH